MVGGKERRPHATQQEARGTTRVTVTRDLRRIHPSIPNNTDAIAIGRTGRPSSPRAANPSTHRLGQSLALVGRLRPLLHC